MRLTRKTLEQANRRMERLVSDDRLDAMALSDALDRVWQPLASALADRHVSDVHAEYAQSLGGDYVGALPTGEVVEWGPDRPTGRGFGFRLFRVEPERGTR